MGSEMCIRDRDSTIYYPIDGRMTLADVAIATRAVPNEFNTGWMLLPPSDEDAMVDEEHALRSAVVGQFAEAIDLAQVKVNEATNAAVRTRVVDVHSLLVAFRNAVADTAIATAQSRYIGWLEQYPDQAHIHLLVKQAVDATITSWQTDSPADYRQVSSQVAGVLKGLTKLHAYEWAWVHRARIAAEAEAEDES